MSTFRAVPVSSRTLILALSLLLTGACRAPAPLDPVAELPEITVLRRKEARPKLSLSIAAGMAADIVPDALLVPAMSSQNASANDRLLRTFEAALKHTDHFEIVSEDRADFRFALTVHELLVEDPDDVGFIDWFSYKFFNFYLTATARLGGALYDGDGDQIGANLERRGQYRILQGKMFRDKPDHFLDLLGTGSSFTKTGSPALANAVQKAIVKLVADIARGTETGTETGAARRKD